MLALNANSKFILVDFTFEALKCQCCLFTASLSLNTSVTVFLINSCSTTSFFHSLSSITLCMWCHQDCADRESTMLTQAKPSIHPVTQQQSRPLYHGSAVYSISPPDGAAWTLWLSRRPCETRNIEQCQHTHQTPSYTHAQKPFSALFMQDTRVD